MPSFSDWLNANAGQEAQTLQNALAKQQGDPNAIGNAYAAGKSGQQAPNSSSNASYGDFLKALSGDYQGANAQTAAQLGMPSAFEGSLAQGAAGDQLKQAQAQYDQQQQAQQNAYAQGQKNADTAGAAAQQKAFQASNFNAGQGNLTPEQAKQAQQDSLKAGAQYRLNKERSAYEKDRANKDKWNEAISDTLNPIGGIGDWMAHAPSHTTLAKFGGHLRDPLNLGGNAHSGFGPGGTFGSPFGMGSSSDPIGGQYDAGDAGFQEWLKQNGYDPATGNGGGY